MSLFQQAGSRPAIALVLVVAVASLAACESVSFDDFGPSLEDDAPLSDRVRAVLAQAPETLNQSIYVKTLDAGMIRLSGLVSNEAVSHRAEQLADAVPGVTGVVNTLQTR